MLLNSACRVGGLLDWHGPPQGRFVHSIKGSAQSSNRLRSLFGRVGVVLVLRKVGPDTNIVLAGTANHVVDGRYVILDG